MTVQVAVELSDATIAEIAQQAASIALDKIAAGSPWLTRKEAAEYLRLPLSRLEKDKTIPCHRDAGRVLYHRDELDEHFLARPCGIQ